MSRIAIAQIAASTEKATNLRLAQELIREAKDKGAGLIAFPEFLMAYSPATQSAEELAGIAEDLDGDFTTTLRAAAKQSSIDLLITVYEKSQVPNRVYDTALWIDSQGHIAAVYRKLHLYDALGFKESDKFIAGEELPRPVKTAAGHAGIMICYDLRFPELSRILTLMGADVLMSPSGWVQGEMKVEHWQTMICARALENGCYVIAPDQVGNIYIGHSMIVDPFGRTVVEMGERQGLEVVSLDLALVQETREKLPLLKNRRADIYAKYAIADPGFKGRLGAITGAK
ncbi:MAG TPA: carbon-nitrogen hydrolase family protein [Candidatus Binatia bacterium]|nr:carbon-nitrogen hydrolase family protein [Candidatus Binatia bacterium]